MLLFITKLKQLFIPVFIILIGLNLYIFVSCMRLGEELNKFEHDITILSEENIQLEKELSRVSSLQFASSQSALMKLTKKSQPIFFENLKYALNR